jgi:hypothetical protein
LKWIYHLHFNQGIQSIFINSDKKTKVDNIEFWPIDM